MPRNQGEKRKKSSFLDYETIKASAVANRDYVNEIKGKIVALKDVDFECLMAMSVVFDLNEDEALNYLQASCLSPVLTVCVGPSNMSQKT